MAGEVNEWGKPTAGDQPIGEPVGDQASTPPPGSSPASPQQSDPQPSDAPSEVKPLEARSRVACVLLAAVIVGALLASFSDIDTIGILDRELAGERVTLAEVRELEDNLTASSIVYTVAYVLAGIGFLLWYSRAYRNTIAMGMTPRYGTRWAVWYWVIPIISFFRPKQVMNDIWRGSDPELQSPAGVVQHRPVAGIMHVWWLFWIVSLIAARVAINLGPEGLFTTQEAKDSAVAYLVSNIADIVAAALAIAVVILTTRRQEERIGRRQLGTLPPAPPGWVD